MLLSTDEDVSVAGTFQSGTSAVVRPFALCLVLDATSRSDAALAVATRMTWPAGARAHVLAIVPQSLPPLGLSPEVQRTVDAAMAGLRRERQRIASKVACHMAARLDAQGVRIEIEVHRGQPSSVVLAWANAHRPDLVVIGARAFSLSKESNLSPTAHRVYSQANCSVLLAREPERAQFSLARRIDHDPLITEHDARLPGDRTPLPLPSGANRAIASGTTVFDSGGGGGGESVTCGSQDTQEGMYMRAPMDYALYPEKDAGTARLVGVGGIELMAVDGRDARCPDSAAWQGLVPRIAKYSLRSVLVVR